jgi:hypothetical protein
MKTMKTSIKTVIGMAVLAILVATNIQAVAKNNAETKINIESAVIESEEIMTLESWMIEDEIWCNETNLVNTEIEVSPELETWMTDKNLWK